MGSWTIAKTSRVVWPNGDADLIVVAYGSANPASPGESQTVQVFIFRSTPAKRLWEGVWSSPQTAGWTQAGVSLIQGFYLRQDAGNGLLAMSILQSVGATNIMVGAEFIHLSQSQSFRMVYQKSLMPDAVITPGGQALMLSDSLCSDGVTKFSVGPTAVSITHKNCAQGAATSASTEVHLAFTASVSGGQAVAQATDSSVTVHVGTTVAFTPGNASTATLMNKGDLALYSDAWNGPPLNESMADEVNGPWVYQFRFVGTYQFVVDAVGGFNMAPAPTWTITVVP